MVSKSYDDVIKAQIKERLSGAIYSWNQGDLDGYMEIYLKSDFVTLILDEGSVYGIGNIRQHYLGQIGKSGKLSFRVAETIILGVNAGAEYAYVSGHFTVEGSGHHAREVKGNFTLLMTRSVNELVACGTFSKTIVLRE